MKGFFIRKQKAAIGYKYSLLYVYKEKGKVKQVSLSAFCDREFKNDPEFNYDWLDDKQERDEFLEELLFYEFHTLEITREMILEKAIRKPWIAEGKRKAKTIERG